MDEAKQELKDIVEFLRDPEKFKALGAKLPKGLTMLIDSYFLLEAFVKRTLI